MQMQHKMELKKSDSILMIEDEILDVQRKFGGPNPTQPNRFSCKIAAQQSGGPFQDIWASVALASLHGKCANGQLVAWGRQDWKPFDDGALSDVNESSLPFSPAGLFAIEAGLPIVTDTNAPITLDPAKIIDLLVRKHFMLGDGGGRERVVVELDPGYPVAPVFKSDYYDFEAFKFALRDIRENIEIGGTQRQMKIGVEGTALNLARFLFEIRQNAFEHASASKSVRLFRIKKRAFNNRDLALQWAQSFPKLREYLEYTLSAHGSSFIYEASISDFGNGIVDNLLDSPNGEIYQDRSREEILNLLLHTQLSSKISDADAGEGITDALWAARNMWAFVSLRTGEFWKYQDTTNDTPVGLKDCFPGKELAKVVGTHWQIIYPGLSTGQPLRR
jgi:hypothetical protein